MLAFALFLIFQDDPSRLVQQLGARSIEAREEAAKKLREMGEKALPELDRAAKDKDAEVAARAERVIQTIMIGRLLGPRVCKALPGVEERLVQARGSVWADTFREAAKVDGVQPQDLEFLAMMAVHEGAGEKATLVDDQAEGRKLAVSVEAVTKLLRSDDVTAKALLSLGRLDRREPPPEFAALLKHPVVEVRYPAVLILSAVGGPGSPAYLAETAKDVDARIRSVAARGLVAAPAREAVPVLRELLRDETFFVRSDAIRSLAALNATEAIGDIASCLDDPVESVRVRAKAALQKLKKD